MAFEPARHTEHPPSGAELWEECPGCHQLLYTKELAGNAWVCARCGHHFRLTVWQRLELTTDPGTFVEWDVDIPINDPLHFPQYAEKLAEARQKTGMSEAVITGRAKIGGIDVALGVMDLKFVGGSMGWGVGEKITRMMERATEERIPVVIFCATGGARMQEGLVSLMQMAKTAGAAAKLGQAGVPYISVLTDPTYGGVTASFAFLGDIIIAEPGAAMGFGGPRVIEVTNIKMPPGVQTAEFQFEHGMLDMLVPRPQLRDTLAALLRWAVGPGNLGPHPGEAQPALQPGLLSLAEDEAPPPVASTERPAGPKLSAWERVELARHPDRPLALDYIEGFVDGFIELHGDRRYGDDGAVVAGIGYIRGEPVAVIGQQKGRTSAERLQRNFGSARPEGYRKALRIMQLAAKLRRPILTLIDTKGADCLEEAEARGISEAIAVNQREMFSLQVPIVCAIIGEGGSGGAIGIGVGDIVLMQENAYYSVIAPESCAAILWRSPERKVEAAEALKLTAADALDLGVATAIVPEPPGGAHMDPPGAIRLLEEAVARAFDELRPIPTDELLRKRYERFRQIGAPASAKPS
jgi:acetyl-CoA carboxylase carboxyl transferase subunit beta